MVGLVVVLVLVLGFAGHFEDEDENEEEDVASPGFNHTRTTAETNSLL